MSDDKRILIVIVFFAFAGFCFGLCVASGVSQGYWHRVCIEHGIAEYDRVTGEWKLIEKPEGE